MPGEVLVRTAGKSNGQWAMGNGRGREGKDAGNDGKIDHPASPGEAQFDGGADPGTVAR
jgi:hypothetical protein